MAIGNENTSFGCHKHLFFGKNDNDIQSACNILYSSGAWNSFSWFRAFESTEMKNIFEDSSRKMASYISSIQVAEKK